MNCPECGRGAPITKEGRLYVHLNKQRKRCPESGVLEVPPKTPSPASMTTLDLWSQAAGDPVSGPEMTPRAAEVAARLKETFFAYQNRRSSDNRSAQATLGPSEIGTPCDRRLAMSLTGMPPVNPGGDGWPAFVGTCVHRGLADMFLWANAGSGRYAVELPLNFPSDLVPYGTGDLLDRTLVMFLDHKVMGRWSLDKLRTKGPSDTYRTQVHTYAYGAHLKGERVEDVAIVGWPREGTTLDDLWVWTEPYNPHVARSALARVKDIKRRLDQGSTSADFSITDDCRYCPWHMPGAQESGEGACNGRT